MFGILKFFSGFLCDHKKEQVRKHDQRILIFLPMSPYTFRFERHMLKNCVHASVYNPVQTDAGVSLTGQWLPPLTCTGRFAPVPRAEELAVLCTPAQRILLWTLTKAPPLGTAKGTLCAGAHV